MMLADGIIPDAYTLNALIEAYSKAGKASVSPLIYSIVHGATLGDTRLLRAFIQQRSVPRLVPPASDASMLHNSEQFARAHSSIVHWFGGRCVRHVAVAASAESSLYVVGCACRWCCPA